MLVYNFLLKHYLLILSLLITSVIAAILEGFGITLVFPVLQGVAGSSIATIPFPFSKIAHIFAGMSLSQRLQIVSLLLLCITIIKGAFIYISVVLTARLQVLVIKQSRVECAKQLLKVGMQYFNRQRGSDFQLIIDGYTDSTAGAIVSLIGTALPTIFTIILLLLFLVLLSWKLTIISIVLVASASLMLSGISRKTMEAGKEVIKERAGFNKILFDIIHGMKLVRLFNREKYMMNQFANKVNSFNQAVYKVTILTGSIGPIFEITGIGILAMILFAGSFIIPHESSVWLGLLLTFVIILTRIINPVKTLNQTRATIISKLPALHELNLFLSPSDKAYLNNGERTFANLQNGIEFSRVKFSYDQKELLVLNEMSFYIRKGSKVGIVGPSGSGKSTITEIMLRFYDPQYGRVLVDGFDLRELDMYSWRRHVGVVTQDTFLFNDTIRANISFANINTSFEEIEKASRKAHIHEFIKSLSQGYDTRIGDRGVLLSGGQRQRIAIARAILADPEILIFDEATSALDTESEQIVQEALDEVGQGKTVITIAHRLSTVSDSDMIIVIDKGTIVEQGSHHELLGNHGLYNKLVEMQTLDRKEPTPLLGVKA